jgi:hypothetical protein
MKKYLILLLLLILVSCTEEQPALPEVDFPAFQSVQKSESDLTIISEGFSYISVEYFDSIPLIEFETYYPFEGEVRIFKGLPLQVFLDWVGIPERAITVNFYAIDDYTVSLPLNSIDDYEYYIVHAADGRIFSDYLGERDRGPFAIVIDVDDLSIEESRMIDYQMIWWLNLITFEQ